MIEFSEEGWRVDPSRWIPTEFLFDPQFGALKSLFYFIILLDCQFPDDSFVGQDMRFNFREDQFAYQIVLLYESLRLEQILQFENYAWSFIVFEEMFEWSEIVVHIDCIRVEVDAD